MKRILSLILVISAVFLAGCDDRAKLEFDTIENVKNGVSKALSQSYDHISVADDITVSIPDHLSTYTPKDGLDFVENENDPLIKSSISLLYDPDDFGKEKHPKDSIMIIPINQDTENPSYQFFNETKDEHCAISRNGYIHLGPNDLLKYDVIECEYAANSKDNEAYQKAIAAADAKMKESAELQSNLEMIPYLVYKIKGESGKEYYLVYFCRTAEGIPFIPFGTDNAINIEPMNEAGIVQRWFKAPFYVCVDTDYSVSAIHIEFRTSVEKKDPVEKIPTLDSVLNYISKETAPNLSVEIKNIQLMLAADMVERTVYPVWYIEFVNKASKTLDKEEYNRIIINASTGLVTSYIENYYEERMGTGD